MSGNPAVKDTPFELDIEDIARDGSGLGHHKRRPVYVPYTLPGERVLARPVEERENALVAEGIKLLDASADRVYPACAHFGPGRCGHCRWQHIGYPVQPLLKQDILAEQLSRVAKLSDPEIDAVLRPIIPSPQEWGFNYHLTFTVSSDPEPKLGMLGTDGRTVVAITECHTLHPDLLELYESLDIELKGIRRIKFQIGTDGERMLILTMLEDDAPELETDLAASVNLILPDNEPMNLIGDSHSRYEVNGRVFRVTAGAYFRPNIPALPAFLSTVETLLDVKPEEDVLDLFAGVGVFSAFAASRARRVTMIESYPPSVTDADENLADFENVDVIEGSVDDVLDSLEERYEVAIIDPPARGGLSDDALTMLAELGVERIGLISDDAGNFAKDVRRFARQGYKLAAAQPFDLAPHTPAVDTVALFRR
jgi:23S rRNA (uracil1939-C5)-methyltransferase